MSWYDGLVLAGNPSIDRAIRDMLPCFSDRSQRRMIRAILDAKKAAERDRDENTDAGARHKFREFISASVLNQAGYSFEYEVQIDGKTPDWFDSKARLLLEAYTFERGGRSPFLDRVKSAISRKCDTYRHIIVGHSLRFVVAVHLDFLTCMTLEECMESRSELRDLFGESGLLWAVLFFAENRTAFSIGGQPYGFLCLTADTAYENMLAWPFRSLCVHG